METAVRLAVSILPLVFFAAVLIWLIRRKNQVSPPPGGARRHQGLSGNQSWAFLAVILVLAAVAMGASNDWSPSSFLIPLGWLATAFVLIFTDRFFDRRITGAHPKVIGPIPFWWVLVGAMPVGWLAGMVKDVDAGPPIWLQMIVLGVLLAAAVTAFGLRYGLLGTRSANAK